MVRVTIYSTIFLVFCVSLCRLFSVFKFFFLLVIVFSVLDLRPLVTRYFSKYIAKFTYESCGRPCSLLSKVSFPPISLGGPFSYVTMLLGGSFPLPNVSEYFRREDFLPLVLSSLSFWSRLSFSSFSLSSCSFASCSFSLFLTNYIKSLDQ